MGWIAEDEPIDWLTLTFLDNVPPEDIIVTVNEEITYTVTEDRYEEKWVSTGELYYKPDYLGMINALEARIAALEGK
jgi:hypothetical protein